LRRVGLIGPADRPELERLAIRIEERGGEAVFLDPSRGAGLSIESGRLSACGADLTPLSSLYVADLRLRARVVTTSDGSVDAEATRASVESSRRELAGWNALFTSFTLRGGLVVNPPAAQTLHGLKPTEIRAYEQMSLQVPATVVTTDPLAVSAELNVAGTKWIAKGLVGGYSHTERIEAPASEAEAAALLAGGPLLAQERIEGTNIRVYVVGGRVLGGAEVITLDGAEIDSRRGKARIRRVDLPVDAARHAVAAASHWGMSFAAVDFMREEGTGRFVLLECNSAPFFVAFEASTGMEISGRLADLLLRVRRA
jgi:glutathione synthase/RimK-type ligase-like ATP-grasp enzyme